MLLFFFMVITTIRDTSLKIEAPKLPSATEVKKLEHKSLDIIFNSYFNNAAFVFFFLLYV